MAKREVPKSLRNWFLIHAVVDIIFAIPLFISPDWVLGLFGIVSPDPVTPRLVGAALLGIGGVSWAAHKKGMESFQTLLLLKIIWSTAAVVGLVWAVAVGAPQAVWLIVVLFLLFWSVWLYYYHRVKKV